MMSSRWNLLWALPWLVITVLVFQFCIFLPLFFLGLPALALALKTAPITLIQSNWWPKRDRFKCISFSWPWLNAWLGNYEDGLCPPWWDAKRADKSDWSKRMLWFIRNPISNLRFWPITGTIPNPSRVKWIGDDRQAPDGVPCFYVAWQGPYVGLRWQGKSYGIWIGWKIKPEDRLGITSYRSLGVACASQILDFTKEQK